MKQSSCRLLPLLMLLVLGLSSCTEEYRSEPPSYDVMFFSPDSIDFSGTIRNAMTFSPGQQVWAGITIVDKGAYITRATQTWKLTGTNIDPIEAKKVVVDPVGKEPWWTFTAPMEEGEYTVTFSEKYSYSASRPDGTIYGQSGNIKARFRVR